MDSIASSTPHHPKHENPCARISAASSATSATPYGHARSSAPNVELTAALQYGAPYSAGARVVSIYEIFLEICKLVLAGGKHANLVPLVTVNRAASEVAPDVLWEEQTEFGNLFRTIPRVEAREIAGCRYIREPIDELSCISHTVQRVTFALPVGTPRRLTEAEYARFHDYARRIKIFLDGFAYEHWKRADGIDPQLVGAVLERGPILPRVHTLRQGGGFRMAFNPYCVNYAVFCCLQPASGDGAHAGLCLMKSTGTASPRNLGMLAAFSNLRSLKVTHEHGDAFGQIASLRDLPYLDTLRLIDFRSQMPFDDEPARASAPGFRSLRTLTFAGDQMRLSLRDARWALRVMSSEPLRLKTLAICNTKMVRNAENQGARRFYATVRECVDLTTLLVPTGRLGCAHRADIFADLCAFKNISRAEIDFNSKNADADGALDLLSSAWPKLVYLTFRYKALTLAGLTPLARRCPELQVLSAAIDMRCIPEPILLSQREVMSERRIKLVLRAGTAPSARDDLMRSLDSIFPPPTLRGISAHRDSCAADYWTDFWTRMQGRTLANS